MARMSNDEAARMIISYARKAARPEVTRKAAVKAALRGMGILKTVTPVDTGLLQKSWVLKKTAGGAELHNTSPYAALVERGRRPGWPPWEPIVRWVARHLRVSLGGADLSRYGQIRGARRSPAWDRVRNMAYGVCKKIATKGILPHPFVRPSLPVLRRVFADEIKKSLAEEASKGVRR